LTLVWREAEATVALRYGDYPFDSEGRSALLLSIENSLAGIVRLTEAGMITKLEAELLTAGLEERLREVPHVQIYEYRLLSCYLLGPVGPSPQNSFERLKRRVPLLQKLAREGTIHRSVLEALRPSLEADLTQLGTSSEDEVVKVRQATEAALAEMRNVTEVKK
jgi:hypothetical protein